jgi:hypothetical protein
MCDTGTTVTVCNLCRHEVDLAFLALDERSGPTLIGVDGNGDGNLDSPPRRSVANVVSR